MENLEDFEYPVIYSLYYQKILGNLWAQQSLLDVCDLQAFRRYFI